MISGKREISDTQTDSKKRKNTRLKKLIIWLSIDLVVVAVLLTLLLHTPSRYTPADIDSFDHDPGQVSPYLTHELSPQFYNGAQRGEPFELVITQKGINEIVAGWGWPRMSEGALLYAPAVLFVPNSVVLMGTVSIKNVEFVVTIALEPKINEEGLANLRVTEVKVGAMNITPLAKLVAKKMYAKRINTAHVDTKAIEAKIAASLLNGESFEPVFEVDKRKVRIEKIDVDKEKLTARLIPAS
ncbi:hypothetical protein ACFL5Z_07470 [Planctomycetota bacterium]